MFDDKTKSITDQILDSMKKHGYDEIAIKHAEQKLKVEKNVNFAIELANILANIEISKKVFDTLQENDE